MNHAPKHECAAGIVVALHETAVEADVWFVDDAFPWRCCVLQSAFTSALPPVGGEFDCTIQWEGRNATVTTCAAKVDAVDTDASDLPSAADWAATLDV